MDQPSTSARLRCGIVLGVQEDACEIIGEGGRRSVRYATLFPSPRTERVSPGHLVAVAIAPDGTEAVVFRWYDAVVLGDDSGQVRLWEPAHGDVVAQSRSPERPRRPGTRAYLSAGLPAPSGGLPALASIWPGTPMSSSMRSSASVLNTTSGIGSYEDPYLRRQ